MLICDILFEVEVLGNVAKVLQNLGSTSITRILVIDQLLRPIMCLLTIDSNGSLVPIRIHIYVRECRMHSQDICSLVNGCSHKIAPYCYSRVFQPSSTEAIVLLVDLELKRS